MKRFWTTAATRAEDGAWAITLDGKPIRTPARVPLLLPTQALGDAVAAEWQAVGERVEPRAMPLTGLANAAIDRIAPAAGTFAAELARYADSDMLLYRADAPEPLVERQRAAWDPPLDWARRRYDVSFEPVTGVMPHTQPAATLARLADAVAARRAFALAGLSPLVRASGSLVLALAVAEGAIDVDAAWHAAQLDEAWQAELWGDDPLAVEARTARRADFDAGARFLTLL